MLPWGEAAGSPLVGEINGIEIAPAYRARKLEQAFHAALLVPIRRLVKLAERLQIPRGRSDVLIGGICGGLPMASQLVAGARPDAMSVCFMIGGLFGGFYFWRRRGFPGLARSDIALVERFYRAVNRLRGRLTR